ncbi:MAG TPA: protein kinase [Gemmatimonadaceae bacterium]|nr:protein kinase [Gemmatimonadaceae bacterium]
MSGVKVCPQCENEYGADVRFCPTDGSTLRATEAGGDLIGLVVADRYLVLEKLGEGGMGRVYLAEHVRMGRRSALKVMNPGMVHDADAIARFNREAANASRISHPNVAAIYDFGETSDGLIYLAMEYVEGEPLTALIERQGALAAPRAGAIAAQVADALAVAHEMGIVHRDLKPDNIMVARGRDGADLVKVVDFGIAKATSGGAQRVTRTGYIVGTPEYMSPEQLAGDAVDGRSDIYALGLVTFHMLTGALPFPSATVQESMIMRLTERPRTLAEARADIDWPGELQNVLDRALARDAGQRYASSAELRQDLLRAVQRMPDTIAAAAGTVIIEAPLPATRVASLGDAGIGAPPVATTASVTRPIGRGEDGTRVPARSHRVFIAIGIAAVLLLGGAGAYVATLAAGAETTRSLAHDTGEGTPEGTPIEDESVAAAPQVTPAAPVASAANPLLEPSSIEPPPSGASTSRTELAEDRVPPGIGHDRTAARESADRARADLDALATLVDVRVVPESRWAEHGRAGLAAVDQILPRLTTSADSIEALYRRAESHAMLNGKEDACETLRAITAPARLASGSGPLRVRPADLAELLHCSQ